MGRIFRVSRPDHPSAMIMKLPRFGSKQGAENLISFETEASILPALSGRHVPRFVAAGEITRIPYLVMVAVDTSHPHDERLPELQRVTAQVLSLSAEFRLACVSVIGAGPLVAAPREGDSAAALHREHLVRLRHWVEPMRLPPHRLALHVIVSANPADALLDFANRNHVDLILLGAPRPSQHALAWWRSAASTVTTHANCSVHVVRVPARQDEAKIAAERAPQAAATGSEITS